jgi:hypothetical protein
MTSSKIKREIQLDANQITDFKGHSMKVEKKQKKISEFYMTMNPGRPDFEKVKFYLNFLKLIINSLKSNFFPRYSIIVHVKEKEKLMYFSAVVMKWAI